MLQSGLLYCNASEVLEGPCGKGVPLRHKLKISVGSIRSQKMPVILLRLPRKFDCTLSGALQKNPRFNMFQWKGDSPNNLPLLCPI